MLEPLRNGRTRIRSALANKYIDLVGMNTSNGAQAQIWLEVPGGNQEWNLERVDDITARTAPHTDEMGVSPYAAPAPRPGRPGAQAEPVGQGPGQPEGVESIMALAQNTTLCYLEKDGAWLMLHRTKKKNDCNHDKWIGGGRQI